MKRKIQTEDGNDYAKKLVDDEYSAAPKMLLALVLIVTAFFLGLVAFVIVGIGYIE